MTDAKARVLFLCTHNSARSQMAEGLLRHLAGERFEAYSAGTEATHVRPLAIRAMDEIGADISEQESETLDRYLGEPFDYAITVCDDANEACPYFPGAKNRLHWSLPQDLPRRRDDLLVDLRGPPPRRGPALRLRAGEVPGGAGPDRGEDEGVA
jgi:arsenate reductase (thioredoxin)